MARSLRIDNPRACHHVMNRGNTGMNLLLKGKKINPARDMAIYLCREMTGETGVALGQYFGGATGAAVTMKHGQVANRIGTDRRLKGLIERIRKQILNI